MSEKKDVEMFMERAQSVHNRLAYLYATTANETVAETFLNESGITSSQWKENASLQATITEYSFGVSDALFEEMLGDILGNLRPFHLSRSRLNIGPASVSTTDTAHETLLDGTKTTGSASAEQISAASVSTKRITVIADPDNADRVLIGNATSQNNELLPGDSITLSIDNVNKIYVKRPAATNVTVTYIATV